ncbi:sodium/solute symporter [Candidatus Latescibacterota bacterium]
MEHTSVSFGWLNWSILVLFLGITTLIGHIFKGDSSSIRGFFLGGRKMPWWAVGGSIVATQASALTFISVPAAVFMDGGDLTYLQMTFGFILGNILMSFIFVKAYYKEEIYSPYEFMGNRLGQRVSQLARFLFIIGAVMSQGVRLLSTALVLSVVTGLPIGVCIFIIGVFSMIWTLLGGITTVIWTDVVQFCVFTLGAIFALLWVVNAVPGGIGEILTIVDEKAKLKLIDISLDPRKTYTLWVGLFGCSIFQLGQNAIDQVSTQRLMCCKSARESQKALILATAGVSMTYLMLAVGLGLIAFYHINPLPSEIAAIMSQEADRIFPYFIVSEIPRGLSGLIIAALFAAGISTLDSALAALSQTSIAGIYRPYITKEASEEHYLTASKIAVIIWAVVLSCLAIFLHSLSSEGLLKLGLKVPGYVYGSLLGIAILALVGKGSWSGILTGTVLSTVSVIGLQELGVSFFWWYPVACIVLVSVVFVFEIFSGRD